VSELKEKVRKSIERLKAFCPEEGYYLAFSGGKDSVVCKALLNMAGVKYDATYRVTSADPPELVRFIKDQHPDVKREVPLYPETYRNQKLAGKPITMWNLIPDKMMPPTRNRRYCCEGLKESGGDGRVTVTGVRWSESVNRKNNQGIVTIMTPDKKSREGLLSSGHLKGAEKNGIILTNDNDERRRLIETCFRRHKTTVNPIIDWTESDVWDFIHAENIQYCELYNEGCTRLGCIGCPMASKRQREKEFLRWPKYKDSYLYAFGKMIEARKTRGKLSSSWRMGTTAIDVFNWWMQYDVLPGQMNMFEDFDETEEDDDD
jgi:phosphoadenosine phosphosulfate reductase